MSTKNDVLELFSNKLYCHILPFVAVILTAVIMPIIILPAFGAQYFADCNDKNQPCVFDYTRYNLYASLFASINGIVTFMFSGFVGSLSDKYGRKPLIYGCIVLAIINNALMIVYINLFLYWTLQAINSMFAIPTIMTAYISDILRKQSLKIIGYSMLFAFGAIFFCVGSILGAIIAELGTNYQYIWITVSALYISLMLYTIFCVKESHYYDHDQQHQTKSFNVNVDINPIKPLFYINSNPIILWMSIVSLIIAIPQSFFGVFLVFLNDELEINNKNQSALLNMTVFVSMATGCVITAAVILPFMKRYKFATDLNLLIIGVIFVIFGELIYSLIPYIWWIDTEIFGVSVDNDSVIFSSFFIVVVCGSISFSFFTFIGSALNSIVTKYINSEEHGLAFGIIQSFGGITSIFAPFSFGYGYNMSKQIGIPSLMLYIICVLLFGCLMILIFPLRLTIKKLDETKQIFFLCKNKIVDSDKISILKANKCDKNNVNNYLTFD